MNILNNPFNILGVTTRDTRKKIIEIGKEKNLFLDSDICKEAISILTHPKNRLIAEVAWMPDVLPSKYGEIIRSLTEDNELSEDLKHELMEYSPITQLNVLSNELEKYEIADIQKVGEKIIYLDHLVQIIEFTELKKLINVNRIAAGFPEVQDIELFIEDFSNHLANICNVINDKMVRVNIENKSCVALVSFIVKNTIDGHFYNNGIIITSILDWYELYSKRLLEEGEQEIYQLMQNIEDDFDSSKINNQVENIIKKLAIWDKLANPLQAYNREKGLVHQSSEQLGIALRNLAMFLHNECEEIDVSQKLILSLGNAFAELDEFAERIDEDIKTLNENREAGVEIERQRAMYLKRVADEERSHTATVVIINVVIFIVIVALRVLS